MDTPKAASDADREMDTERAVSRASASRERTDHRSAAPPWRLTLTLACTTYVSSSAM
jgi:hypothetical protein